MMTLAEPCDAASDGARPPVSLRGLSKKYGDVEAVKDVSLNVRQGELFALLGPDGAGKTTLCQLIAGVLSPTAGTAELLDRPAAENCGKVGYLTQHFSLYGELSIDENLRYAAGMRNVSEADFLERRETYLKLVELLQFKNRLAGHLSGGMKQKLALCCALIGRPSVLVLDEPTTGLDPISRREFWHLLGSIADRGTTIVVATPQFDEAELCDRVALMYEGKIYKVGSPDELRSTLTVGRLEIITQATGRAESLLKSADWTESELDDLHVYGDRIDVLAVNAEAAYSCIQRALVPLDVSFTAQIQEPTLENVFIANLRDEGFIERPVPPNPGVLRTSSARPHTSAIQADKLTKRFGDFTAVKAISFDIRYGEIYGLLGANGAGKTTTVQMLSGLIQPSSGKIKMGGMEGRNRNGNIRHQLGYMSQKFTLYDDLTVLENLNFYASAYSIPSSVRRQKIEWVLELCNLHDRANVLVKHLPRGLRQRIAFGASVMHEPEILFLDEPTAGVDPLSRRQVWNVIRELAQRGTAILATTHFLADAEYCNRLGLMVNGELVAEGNPSQIKQSAHEVIEVSTPQVQTAYEALSDGFGASSVSVFPGRVHIESDAQPEFIERLLSILRKAEVEVKDVQPVPSSLEDAFVSVVRRNSEDRK